MTDPSPTPGTDGWDRPLFSPGGGDAFIYFVVFGTDADLLEISADEHRVDEIPAGIDAHQLGADGVRSFFEPPMGDQLRARDPDTAAAAEAAGSCTVVTGTVADPASLDYLRNVIGITTAALDTGGVAVLSLQTLDLFDPDRWRADVFEAGRALPHHLVTVLVSDEDDADGTGLPDDADDPTPSADPTRDPAPRAPDRPRWVHTRGLRAFGRPDLSVHDVAPDDLELVNRLVGALVAQLARGLVIHDGMTMAIGGEVGTVRFERRGHLDDPDFNNEHLEITRA